MNNVANSKRVFYIAPHMVVGYADILGGRGDVRLDKLENDSADDVAAPILAGAHAFQIGSARDELARKYHADRGPAAPGAEPADRFDPRRRLRYRQP